MQFFTQRELNAIGRINSKRYAIPSGELTAYEQKVLRKLTRLSARPYRVRPCPDCGQAKPRGKSRS